MNDPLSPLDPTKETDYKRLEDVNDRFPKTYDDVFLGDGSLVQPASVLD